MNPSSEQGCAELGWAANGDAPWTDAEATVGGLNAPVGAVGYGQCDGPDYYEGDTAIVVTTPPFRSLMTSPVIPANPTQVQLELSVDGGTPVVFTWSHGPSDPTGTIQNTAAGDFQAILSLAAGAIFENPVGRWCYVWIGSGGISKRSRPVYFTVGVAEPS